MHSSLLAACLSLALPVLSLYSLLYQELGVVVSLRLYEVPLLLGAHFREDERLP